MPAVTIADAVQISDSPDAKAVLQADSTTQYFLPPRMTTAQKEAIVSPAEGAVVFDTDLNYLSEYTGATWQAVGGGSSSGAPTDATYITQTANGSLSNEQALGALATGIVKNTTTTGVLSIAAAGTDYLSPTGSETVTNKTFDADNNTVSNIGSSEVKAELITGLTADATPDGAADYVMTYDNSATALKKVLLNNLPTGSGATVVAANKVHKFGAAQSTTSTTMVDVDATNAAITITATGGGKALVMFSFRGQKITAGNGFFRMTDGTNHSDEVEFASSGSAVECTLMWIFDTSAGSTTYKLQFRSSDANAVQVSAQPSVSMIVREIA